MRRTFTLVTRALVLTATLAAGCGEVDDASLADAPSTSEAIALSPAAAAFVTETTNAYDLEAACDDESAARSLAAWKQRSTYSVRETTEQKMVMAYLARGCAPCFSVAALSADLWYVADDRPRDPAVSFEVMGASVPPELRERASEGILTNEASIGADYWEAHCVDWQARVDALTEDLGIGPTTTTAPPDGPNEQSYGDGEDRGMILSHPDAGPPPELLWAVMASSPRR